MTDDIIKEPPTHKLRKVLPEHSCDYLPGERENPNPDTGDCHSLQKLVKLVVSECWKTVSQTKSTESKHNF